MSPPRLRLAAPAKLNLFLHITGRRPDGYHNLQTVFQFLDRADQLEFTLRSDERIELCDPLPGLPAESDLVLRAARLLREHVQADPAAAGLASGARHSLPGVSIRREKILPLGGGLGGGSSNAATTLVALHRLWQLALPQQQLLALALQLGADVPVFVHGQACWAEGVGESFTDLTLPEPDYLVLTPPVSVATAEVFCAEQLTRNCSPITIRDFLDGSGRNVCEPVVRSLYPAVAQALDWLATHAQQRPAMSGTGSCVFVRCKNRQEALNLLELLEAEAPGGMNGFIARGRNCSPLYEQVEAH